ncbi:unnamed protein product [Symbiodinium sp. CCMP2592]|nr:unnamed protein product [Symbiodinium sp. CCMP2592]
MDDGSDDDVAVKAAEALGSLASFMEVAVDPRRPDASAADPLEPGEKAKQSGETRAVSKASVRDLRSKLEQKKGRSASAEPGGPVLSASEELKAKLQAAKERMAREKEAGKRPLLSQILSPEPKAPAAPSSPLTPTGKKSKKDKKKDKEKDRKKDKKEEAVPIRQTKGRPMPKQQALPLVCKEKEPEQKPEEAMSASELERKIALEKAKARRLEELREREAQKVQQVHSKAAARKKKEVEDSVRDLARKLSQDILEISETINVENIKQEVKREGRAPGHFGNPLALSQMKAEVKQEVKQETRGLGTEGVKGEMKSEPGAVKREGGQSSNPMSHEQFLTIMSQLKQMPTPESMALSSGQPSSSEDHGTAEEEAQNNQPSVCTIGWEPNVDPSVMLKMLEGYRVGSIVDARPAEYNTDGFAQACAAHGWTYDRQPVLAIHPYDLGPMQMFAYNAIGRIVSQARASVMSDHDGSCKRQCILFAGDQQWISECNWHIIQRLQGCSVDVLQINLDKYWEEAAVLEEENEKGGVMVAGPALTQVVDELRSQVGLPKIGDERDRQLMVTARAGLETWVQKKFKQDLRLREKCLPPEATLKEKIDCLRDACPELSRVVSMAHFLRMIGNNSAHTGGAAIPPRYQLVQLVQKLTSEIKESDAQTKAHDEADKKWEAAEPFAAVLAKIAGEPAPARAPASARLQLPQSLILPKDGQHKATLVYLHPFGAGNVRYLQAKSLFASQGVRLVLPLAPNTQITAYNKRPCISWFDYYNGSKELEADPLSLEDIRVRLSLTLEREATLLGEDGHKRLIVGGLAQGAEAALHAVLMHHQVLAGYVGVCGNLLPCTLPEGPGKVKLHFFDYGERDPKVWVHQTRDPLLKHHDLTEHGAIFDNGVEGLPKDFRKGHLQGVDLSKIDHKLEAQCLQIACEAILQAEETETGETAEQQLAAEVGAPDETMETEEKGEEAEPEIELTDADLGIEPEPEGEEKDPLLLELGEVIDENAPDPEPEGEDGTGQTAGDSTGDGQGEGGEKGEGGGADMELTDADLGIEAPLSEDEVEAEVEEEDEDYDPMKELPAAETLEGENMVLTDADLGIEAPIEEEGEMALTPADLGIEAPLPDGEDVVILMKATAKVMPSRKRPREEEITVKQELEEAEAPPDEEMPLEMAPEVSAEPKEDAHAPAPDPSDQSMEAPAEAEEAPAEQAPAEAAPEAAPAGQAQDAQDAQEPEKAPEAPKQGESDCLLVSAAQATLGLLETGSMAPKSAEFASTAERAEKFAKRAIVLAREQKRTDLMISALCTVSQSQYLSGEKHAGCLSFQLSNQGVLPSLQFWHSLLQKVSVVINRDVDEKHFRGSQDERWKCVSAMVGAVTE